MDNQLEEYYNIAKASLISTYMTEDYTKEIKECKKHQLLSLHINDIPNIPINDCDMQIPLFSIGNSQNRGAFCRMSVDVTNIETLYISFRPLNLLNIDNLSLTDKYNIGLKYFFNKYDKNFKNVEIENLGCETYDNILNLINMISSPELDDTETISIGYEQLINKIKYKITKEFQISKKYKKLENILKKLPSFEYDKEYSIIHILTDIINSNCFTNIVFTGFSLGSGMALASSYFAHKNLTSNGKNIPNFYVYQFAGTKVGSIKLKNYFDSYKGQIHIKYVALRNTKYEGIKSYDNVTYIPYNNDVFVHCGEYYELDFYKNDIKKTIHNPNIFKNINTNKTNLLLSYITDFSVLSPLYISFKYTHLEGEQMIPKILFYKIFQYNKKSNKKSNKIKKNMLWINDIPENWFFEKECF